MTRATPAAAKPAAGGTLSARQAAFERYLAQVLPRATQSPQRLHAAMRYGALSPGKRVRALLALTACEAAGGDWRRALPAAAAVECVHAFSLVHDDLPAMDNDDYRRGRLTTHRRYGEALGILTGDALLALAFEEVVRLVERGVPALRVVAATRLLAQAAGSLELVGGQVLDLEAEKRRATPKMVVEIHLRKTGALISAALVLGGIAGGAKEAALQTLAQMGRELGLAFQIQDDLLNRSSSLQRLGKRAGTDAVHRKATYPGAAGEERARGEAARLYLRVLERIEDMGPAAENLGRLVIKIGERRR